MTPAFDREEMIRLSREGMENSIRFFLTLNENILKMGEWHKDFVEETTRRNLEVVNKAFDEYQKNSRVICSRIESVCRTAIDQISHPREKAQE